MLYQYCRHPFIFENRKLCHLLLISLQVLSSTILPIKNCCMKHNHSILLVSLCFIGALLYGCAPSPNAYSSSMKYDTAIQRAARRVIQRNSTLAKDHLTVSTHSGQVTLTGSVDSVALKKKAGSLILRVIEKYPLAEWTNPPVQPGVINHLVVSSH